MLRELLSVKQAAERLGVHQDTLYAAIESDRLPYVDCDGKRMLLAEDLTGFRVRQRGRPKKEKHENH